MTSKKSKNFPKSWPKKAPQKDIRTNLLKENVDVFGKKHEMTVIPFILQNFPTNWNKQTSYLHIKKSKLSKENYRPISILPNVSKIYERCLYDQIATYFEHIFSRYQCGSCKGYSAQQCLLTMIEKWKNFVDNGSVFGALLTDLSKAFDCIPHDLIIAKLEAYGLQIDESKLFTTFIIQYTFLWPIVFFGRLRHCKLCGWHYNLYGKRKKRVSH